MRNFFITVFLFFLISAHSQSNTSSSIIEGSKVLVELIRVFKAPKAGFFQAMPNANAGGADSCIQKQIADICYKNTSGNTVAISLFKRNGTAYAAAFTLKIANSSLECLYELPAGIYKYKVEAENINSRTVINEGELRLNSCDKILNEIKK